MRVDSLNLTRAFVYFLILFIGVLNFIFEKNFINSTFYINFYTVLLISLIFSFALEILSSFLKRLRDFKIVLNLIDIFTVAILMFILKGPLLLFSVLFLVFILISSLQNEWRQGLGVALCSALAFTVISALIFESMNFNSILVILLHDAIFIGLAIFVGVYRVQFFEVQGQLQTMGLSLRAFQELNRIIMNNLPVGVVSFTESGEVLSLNPFAEKIDILNAGVDFLKLKSNQKTEFQAPNSKTLSFSHNVYQDPKDHVNIHIAVVEDLTEFRKLEDLARQSEKLAAIGGLAAGIAHEIRNPLASISGSVEMLSQTGLGDDDQKLMKIVLKEIQRLNNLITEFLDYARPEKPYTDKINLSLLVGDVLESLKQDKNLTDQIKVVKEFSENVQILGSSEKLKQVFLNLFVNSFQALRDRKEAFVKCSIQENQNRVQVLIEDNGSGMGAEVQRRLFEPFFTTKSKGTGLGLAITYKIIQTHRGTIEVRSEEGQGTVFTLTFPLCLT